MFLSMLNDQQKLLFRELCLYIVYADGIYTDDEELLVKSYCYEMKIEYTPNKQSKDYASTVNQIVKISTDYEKRLIGFELMGVVYADGEFQDEECDLIKIYSKVSGIPMDKLNEFGELVQQAIVLDKKIINALES